MRELTGRTSCKVDRV